MGIYDFIKTVKCAELKTPYIDKKGIREELINETGRDRLIRMYSKTPLNTWSPELSYCLQTGTGIAALSGFVGAMKQMLHTKQDYIRKNKATTYESTHLARRHLTDKMTLSAFSGAFKYAVKYGLFGSLYILSTMSAANYRNEIWALDHALTAAVLGGFSRVMYGPKGFLVASALGGFLGLIGGGMLKLNMHLSGMTVEDLRYYQHESYHSRFKKPETDD